MGVNPETGDIKRNFLDVPSDWSVKESGSRNCCHFGMDHKRPPPVAAADFSSYEKNSAKGNIDRRRDISVLSKLSFISPSDYFQVKILAFSIIKNWNFSIIRQFTSLRLIRTFKIKVLKVLKTGLNLLMQYFLLKLLLFFLAAKTLHI